MMVKVKQPKFCKQSACRSILSGTSTFATKRKLKRIVNVQTDMKQKLNRVTPPSFFTPVPIKDKGPDETTTAAAKRAL